MLLPCCGFNLLYFVSSLLLGEMPFHVNVGHLDVLCSAVRNSHLLPVFLVCFLFLIDLYGPATQVLY